MAEAIVLTEHGGPKTLTLKEVAVGKPGAGELRVRQTAIGVNFHDCYVRSGLYKTLQLPGIPGIEGAGIVEEVGAGVTGFAHGDRIGYVTTGYGGYASERILPAHLALKLPVRHERGDGGGRSAQGIDRVDVGPSRPCRATR